jgi:hypothetical protein
VVNHGTRVRGSVLIVIFWSHSGSGLDWMRWIAFPSFPQPCGVNTGRWICGDAGARGGSGECAIGGLGNTASLTYTVVKCAQTSVFTSSPVLSFTVEGFES